jgi:hypothetical protein
MDTQHTVIFSGVGEYVPVRYNGEVVWYRDTTGDPLAAWKIESMQSARRFASLVRLEAFEEWETRKW